jgi:hypothetical protein
MVSIYETYLLYKNRRFYETSFQVVIIRNILKYIILV